MSTSFSVYLLITHFLLGSMFVHLTTLSLHYGLGKLTTYFLLLLKKANGGQTVVLTIFYSILDLFSLHFSNILESRQLYVQVWFLLKQTSNCEFCANACLRELMTLLFASIELHFCCGYEILHRYEPHHEKTCLREFPTRLDTNRPEQPQKLARVLKFRL